MNNISEQKAEKHRQRFVEYIGKRIDEICALAKQHHPNGSACKPFKSMTHGSFNLCIFVEFTTPPFERWVIRMPILGLTPWIDEKMDAELATMRYVATQTTIPVPQVHAYSFTQGSPIGIAYMITDYIEGKTLQDLGFQRGTGWGIGRPTLPKKTKRIYQQLASIYVQLRQLEFPKIGALGLPDGSSEPLNACDPDKIQVCNRPLTVEMAMQQSEEFDPSAEMKPKTSFHTTRDFVDHLNWLSENQIEKSPNIITGQERGCWLLYARDRFRHYTTNKWLDERNEGPFFLMHGDFIQHPNNVLFNEDFEVVAVIDWEWSYVGPAQFSVPPTWLTGSGFDFMLSSRRWYNTQVEWLTSEIRSAEDILNVPSSLSQDWAKMTEGCNTAVVVALLYPDMIFNAFWDLVFYVVEGLGQPKPEEFKSFCEEKINPRLEAFMANSPGATKRLNHKIQEYLKFHQKEKEQ